ncbi:MAG: hypothetical protein ABW137_18865 [Mycobacterium sp.]
MQQSRKMRAALVAGAALVAAGTFATALGEETVDGGAPNVVISSSGMTLGDTATTTSVPTAPATAKAQPVLKATVPCGFTSSC